MGISFEGLEQSPAIGAVSIVSSPDRSVNGNSMPWTFLQVAYNSCTLPPTHRQRAGCSSPAAWQMKRIGGVSCAWRALAYATQHSPRAFLDIPSHSPSQSRSTGTHLVTFSELGVPIIQACCIFRSGVCSSAFNPFPVSKRGKGPLDRWPALP
jgi:hypothetical protein